MDFSEKYPMKLFYKPGYKKTGVFFIYYKEKVIYIGKSTDITSDLAKLPMSKSNPNKCIDELARRIEKDEPIDDDFVNDYLRRTFFTKRYNAFTFNYIECKKSELENIYNKYYFELNPYFNNIKED